VEGAVGPFAGMRGSPASQRPRILTLVLLLALILTGCGAAARTTSTIRSGLRVRAPKVFVHVPGQALVAMRQYDAKSLLWQTIFVRRDGSGVLTTLIGEIGGAPQRSFQLPSGELTSLRRLIEAVRANGHGSGSDALEDGFVYSLHIEGLPSQNAGGAAPKPVAKLIDFLSGLTLTYCC
jgi:hypothetical protein